MKEKLYRKEIWLTVVFAVLLMLTGHSATLFVLFPGMQSGTMWGFPIQYIVPILLGWFGLAVVCLLSAAAIGLGGVRIAPEVWFKLVAVLLLGTAPFCALGLRIGTLVKGQAAVAIVNLVYLPMSVLSGLWMPLFAFPKFLQEMAVIWPAWHLSQMALGVVGQLEGVRYLLHAGVLVVMSVLFLALAARAMQRA